jgi:hypothetical protein
MNEFTVKRYLNEEIEQALPLMVKDITKFIQIHRSIARKSPLIRGDLEGL